ncbi:hypothetical protein D3C80_1526100 [compost metagenome]
MLVWPAQADFVMGKALPFPIVSVHQGIKGLYFCPRRAGDLPTRIDAARQRARIDNIGLPGFRYSFAECSGLLFSYFRQRNFCAAAKALRGNPVHMPVAGENDSGHTRCSLQ